jgi:hypothetical protein
MIINIAIRDWWNACIALGRYLIILMGIFRLSFFCFCSFAYLVQVYEIVIKSKWTRDQWRSHQVEITFFFLFLIVLLTVSVYVWIFFLLDNEIREFSIYDDRQLLLCILIDWKYQLDWRKKKQFDVFCFWFKS